MRALLFVATALLLVPEYKNILIQAERTWLNKKKNMISVFSLPSIKKKNAFSSNDQHDIP